MKPRQQFKSGILSREETRFNRPDSLITKAIYLRGPLSFPHPAAAQLKLGGGVLFKFCPTLLKEIPC